MKINVETRDGIIWNKDIVALEIAKCMSTGDKLQIDLKSEGPDCKHIGLYDLLYMSAELFNYDLSKIDLYSCNALEKHDTINIIFTPSLHLLDRELRKKYDFMSIKKNNQLKHFGRFIGRSNSPRLMLSTYLDNHYADKSILTYQYKFNEEYHRREIGLEGLINDYNKKDISSECKFLQSCPRQVVDIDFKFNKTTTDDFSSQLHLQENGKFIDVYRQFFVEIVSETYFSGNTFFLTEKIFRPILLKTPFIVQGPQWFLYNLKKLGFKTFDQWWDEGYSEDPADYQPTEIQKVIATLAALSVNQISTMYEEMQSILDFNQKRLLELTIDDFANIGNNESF